LCMRTGKFNQNIDVNVLKYLRCIFKL